MAPEERAYAVRVDEKEFEVRVARRGDVWSVYIDNQGPYTADFVMRGPIGQYSLLLDHHSYEGIVQTNGEGLKVWVEGEPFDVAAIDLRLKALAAGGVTGVSALVSAFKTPMPGMVVAVLVGEGEEVKKGQPLVTLEAMKMRNDLKSPRDGRIKAVAVREGQTVAKGDVLVEFEA